jgi:hypothetical protein
MVLLWLTYITSCSSTTPLSSPVPSNTSQLTVTNSPNSKPFAEATVNVSIDEQNIKAGDSFKVNILIDTQTASRGAQWKLSFDPKTLRCDSVNEGTFFKDWAAANNGTTIVLPKPDIDNNAGQVSDMGIAIMGGKEGGPMGSGVLCTYQFTALSGSIVPPALSNVVISDINGKTFRVTAESSE